MNNLEEYFKNLTEKRFNGKGSPLGKKFYVDGVEYTVLSTNLFKTGIIKAITSDDSPICPKNVYSFREDVVMNLIS